MMQTAVHDADLTRAVLLRGVARVEAAQDALKVYVSEAREQGWSWDAIADALGVPPTTARRRYASATGPT